MANDSLFLQRTINILTNEVRLKMLGLVALRAHSLVELASLLKIKIPLAARHLRKLQHLGIIELQVAKSGQVARYKLDMESFRLLKNSWFASQESLFRSDEITLDETIFAEWERKIIQQFFAGTQLMVIPAGRKQLEVIVKWFAQLFEIGRRYQEKEVNETIQRHYYDYAFFKKDLVGRGYMRRENGILWRVHQAQTNK